MADRLNPGEQTAAESDYQKKFNKDITAEAKDLKDKESAPQTEWKTVTKKKADSKKDEKGRFRLVGRKAGALRNGSAFLFVIGIIGLGVVYTSVFVPNIILVNLKEMYTNDLSDATIALNSYYWKLMNYKIGQSQCSDKQSIKCKLSTMSRAQYLSFQKHGFTVLGSKVQEDNRDDGQPGNELPESRYQVSAIIPPVQSPGLIATGDMLYLYAQLSSANKALVYGVFNPKSSFFMDTRFKQRLKTKYDLTKDITVGGDTEQAVNKSFDASMTGSSEGISLVDAEPNKSGGVSLGSLGSPVVAASYETAAQALAAPTTSYVGLQCAWYALANAVTNDAKTAKAHTLARFALQYLRAADQIKVGTSQDVTISTLSSNLAQSTGGGYSGANATDSSMYKSITYGSLPIPSPYGFLYSEDTFDLIGALAPAWSQIMITATAVGQASNASGSLAMPPANLTGTARDYCLSGETQASKDPVKEDKCETAITASAPPGTEGLISGALAAGRETCPHLHYDEQDQTFEGQWLMTPSVKAAAEGLTAYVAGIFSANVAIWAKATSLLFNSNTKGVAASDAIFAGTGELLGDMAMSRGMEPANAATMGIYLAQKDTVDKQYEDVARYNAQKQPFDIYNQYSFLGSIVHGLTPTYDNKTPLFSTVANSMSLLTDSLKGLNSSANAFYYSQPEIPTIDPLNPAATTAQHATGLAQYLLRLNCPDPEYLAIGIMADSACNVRYVMGKQELTADVNSVLDYMTKSHSDLTQKNIDELTQRVAQADQEGDQANVQRMLDATTKAANQPEIDQETGQAIKGSEYEKYLNYCVNRQDPWGRSGIAVTYSRLSNDQVTKKGQDKQDTVNPISPNDSGDPYQQTPSVPYPSISEGASQDQDWYTGKKCLEQSEELMNFRAYTMICSVDGSLSGAVDCTYNDDSVSTNYSNDYYSSNDILYLSNN